MNGLLDPRLIEMMMQGGGMPPMMNVPGVQPPFQNMPMQGAPPPMPNMPLAQPGQMPMQPMPGKPPGMPPMPGGMMQMPGQGNPGAMMQQPASPNPAGPGNGGTWGMSPDQLAKMQDVLKKAMAGMGNQNAAGGGQGGPPPIAPGMPRPQPQQQPAQGNPAFQQAIQQLQQRNPLMMNRRRAY